jgi:hypothetical protein
MKTIFAPKKTFSTQVIFLIVLIVVVLILAALLPAKLYSVDSFTTNYSSSVNNSPIDSMDSELLNPSESSCIHTVNGLHCNGGGNDKIDQFNGLPSSVSCPGSGLTKSGGNVCLDKNTNDLMTSRGKNITWSVSPTMNKK